MYANITCKMQGHVFHIVFKNKFGATFGTKVLQRWIYSTYYLHQISKRERKRTCKNGITK